jgi:hypothetical protein
MFHTRRTGRRIVKNTFTTTIRHNPAVPFLSYIKDKGTQIPFARQILKEDEYERYQLYTELKKGNVDWLREHVKTRPFKKEEKETVISYIKGLKDQPYSIPNIAMGYFSSSFGFNAIYYSISGVFLPIISAPAWQSDYLQYLSHITGMGSIAVDAFGVSCIFFGLRIIANELRSPYFNYDEMLRICNESVNLDK